jgi:hypothetical protein
MSCGDNSVVSDMLPKTADVVPSGKIALITGITGQVRGKSSFCLAPGDFVPTKAKVFFVYLSPGQFSRFNTQISEGISPVSCRMARTWPSSSSPRAIKSTVSSGGRRASTPAAFATCTRIPRHIRRERYSSSTTAT